MSIAAFQQLRDNAIASQRRIADLEQQVADLRRAVAELQQRPARLTLPNKEPKAA